MAPIRCFRSAQIAVIPTRAGDLLGIGDAPAYRRTMPVPLPAAPGVGIGRAWLPGADRIDVPEASVAVEHAVEHTALDVALADVGRAIAGLRARTAREVGEADAAVFDAHLLFLVDEALVGRARARIDAGDTAASAWVGAVGEVEARLAGVAHPAMRERAADVRAVGDQVLRALLGLPAPDAAGEGVLVAADLTPAQAAQLDPARVAAVVLARGSATTHASILVRGRGIPLVVAAGDDVLRVPAGTLLAVDGSTGEVVVDPVPDVVADFLARRDRFAAARAQALARAGQAAVTRGGRRVPVGANLGSLPDAVAATAAGADLAGLVRTELLFLDRDAAPDVDEQHAAYLAVAAAMGGRRITLRTLDAGGDKTPVYLAGGRGAGSRGAGSVVGLRGLRLSLARPGLLADQLLAVVRAAHETPVTVLFPFVTTVTEVRLARSALDEAIAADGRGTPPGLEVGVMVEVPVLALKTAHVAPLVDLLAIGTNDLTQYATAAERGDEATASFGDPYDPGVLRLVQHVCDAAGGTAVGVCGELAADPAAVPLLLGLGVGALSVSPAAVPMVKAAVRAVGDDAARRLAARAVALESADDVRRLLATP